jgi:predicted O-methyltransferase YrrM
VIHFPYEIDGWLTEIEGRALGELAAGKNVLEVGSYCGRSTVCLAQTALTVCSVDPYDGRATPSERDTYAEFQANLKRYGLETKVTAIRGTFQDQEQLGKRFHLAFIDGDHGFEAVHSDAAIATRLLLPGGLLAFHDYRLFIGEHDGRWDGGVTEAVNDLLRNGAELLERHGTIAVIRPNTSH